MAMVFGRSSWNALPPHWVVPPIDELDAFVIHHSVTAQPSSFDESIAQVQAIQRFHLSKTKPDGSWEVADIQYNIIAGWNCAIVGRGVTLMDGATDTDPTTRTWSVCVLGDYSKDLVTPEIRNGILTALKVGADLYGSHPIRPHRDYYPTACPGANLVAAIPTLHEEVDMTPLEYFGHPLVLSDGDPPVPYPTSVEGWHIYTHRELQLIRQALQKLEAKL